MEAYDGKINNESPKNNHSLHFEKCLSKDLDDSTSRTRIQSRQRKHRYKNTLHLWEFLLELLADESCKSIICWRRKEYGEFQLIDHHEVAKRWGQLKKRNDMNYSKLSRALRLYYQQGIITKVSLTNQKIMHVYFEEIQLILNFEAFILWKDRFCLSLVPNISSLWPSSRLLMKMQAVLGDCGAFVTGLDVCVQMALNITHAWPFPVHNSANARRRGWTLFHVERAIYTHKNFVLTSTQC